MLNKVNDRPWIPDLEQLTLEEEGKIWRAVIALRIKYNESLWKLWKVQSATLAALVLEAETELELLEVRRKATLSKEISGNAEDGMATNGCVSNADTRINIETESRAEANSTVIRTQLSSDAIEDIAASIIKNYVTMASKKETRQKQRRSLIRQVWIVLWTLFKAAVGIAGITNMISQVSADPLEENMVSQNPWTGPANFVPEHSMYFDGKVINWVRMPDDLALVISGFREANPEAQHVQEMAKICNALFHTMMREGINVPNTIARILAGGEVMQPPTVSERRRDLELVLAQVVAALNQMGWESVEVSVNHWHACALDEKKRSASEEALSRPRRRASEIMPMVEPDFGDPASFPHGAVNATNLSLYQRGWKLYKNSCRENSEDNKPIPLIPTGICEVLGAFAPNWIGSTRAVPACEIIKKVMDHVARRVSTQWKMETSAIILLQAIMGQKNERSLKILRAETAQQRRKSGNLAEQLEEIQAVCDSLTSRSRKDDDTIEAQAYEIHKLKCELSKAQTHAETSDAKVRELTAETEDLYAVIAAKEQQIAEESGMKTELHDQLLKVQHIVKLYEDAQSELEEPANLTDLETTPNPQIQDDDGVLHQTPRTPDYMQTPSDGTIDESLMDTSRASSSSGVESAPKETPMRKKIGPPGLRCAGASVKHIRAALEASLQTYLEEIRDVVRETAETLDTTSTIEVQNENETVGSGETGQESGEDLGGLEEEEAPTKAKRPRSPHGKSPKKKGNDL